MLNEEDLTLGFLNAQVFSLRPTLPKGGLAVSKEMLNSFTLSLLSLEQSSRERDV